MLTHETRIGVPLTTIQNDPREGIWLPKLEMLSTGKREEIASKLMNPSSDSLDDELNQLQDQVIGIRTEDVWSFLSGIMRNNLWTGRAKQRNSLLAKADGYFYLTANEQHPYFQEQPFPSDPLLPKNLSQLVSMNHFLYGSVAHIGAFAAMIEPLLVENWTDEARQVLSSSKTKLPYCIETVDYSGANGQLIREAWCYAMFTQSYIKIRMEAMAAERGNATNYYQAPELYLHLHDWLRPDVIVSQEQVRDFVYKTAVIRQGVVVGFNQKLLDIHSRANEDSVIHSPSIGREIAFEAKSGIRKPLDYVEFILPMGDYEAEVFERVLVDR